MKTLYSDGFGDDTARERLPKREWLTKFKNDGYGLIDTLKESICLSVKSPHQRKRLVLQYAEND